MAESPFQSREQSISEPDNSEYWCYHCEKHVSIETLANLSDIVCHECKNGFIESVPAVPRSSSTLPSGSSDHVDDPSFGSQFIQVLRLLAQTASDEDAPAPPPQNYSSEDDFLRIELNGWDNEEDEEDANGVEYHVEQEEENGDDEEYGNRSVVADDEGNEESELRDDDDLRRTRNDVLRLRIRDFATRAQSGRNRILDWAEILMGLEDNSIEFRLEMPDSDRYIGNPADYVDAAGYEALLQTLAENDGVGRRGAPPASKSAISAIPTVEIKSEQEALLCAVCKDMVSVGDIAKKLPCGHGYHGDCIIPWLGSRNSCPVCRFELPTDDAEYEEEKKRKNKVTANDGGASSSSGDNLISD